MSIPLTDKERKVLEYIEQYEKKGYSDKEIKIALQKSNIPEDMIRKGMRTAHPLFKNPWLWVGIGIFVLAVSVALFLYFSPHPQCSTDSDCPRGYSCIDQECIKDQEPEIIQEEPVVIEEQGSVCGDGTCDTDEVCVPDCGCDTNMDCESYYNSIYYGCSFHACVLQGPAESSNTGGGGNDQGSSSSGETSTTTAVASETNCTDGVDNDSDGAIDCDDSDCATDSACTTGVETACLDESDCLPYDCDASTGLCYETCTSDADCGSNNECNSGVCVECDTSEDCPDNYACDLTSYTCVDLCTDNEDCADGFICDTSSGVCTQGCTEDSECPDNFACTSDGTCVDSCVVDSDCAQGYICDPSTGSCVEDTLCHDDTECEDGACIDGICYECKNNEYCNEGYICDLDTYTCTDYCVDAGDCAAGYFCGSDTHTCTISTCNDADCFFYICDPNADACYTSCVDDSVCAAGYVCVNGSCAPSTLSSSCNGTVPTCSDGIDNDGDLSYDYYGVCQTESTGDNVNDFGACDSDAQMYCSGLYNSDWAQWAVDNGYTSASWKYALVDCLGKNPVSQACDNSLDRRQQLNEALLEACAQEQVAYCSDTIPLPGYEPLVDCLNENIAFLSSPCLDALYAHEAAQLVEGSSYYTLCAALISVNDYSTYGEIVAACQGACTGTYLEGDSDCTSENGNTELDSCVDQNTCGEALPGCADGVDNDGDGFVDLDDTDSCMTWTDDELPIVTVSQGCLIDSDCSVGESCDIYTGVCYGCSETDTGLDYATAGTTTGIYTGIYSSVSDSCLVNGELLEYYCTNPATPSTGEVYSVQDSCTTLLGQGYYCSNGACVSGCHDDSNCADGYTCNCDTGLCEVDDQITTSGSTIQVCKTILDENGMFTDGSEMPGVTFTVSWLDSSDAGNAIVVPSDLVFTTPLTLNSNLFSSDCSGQFDSECRIISADVLVGDYYYDEEVISPLSSSWLEPLYTDQYNRSAHALSDLLSYDDTLFDGNPGNDGSRDFNADGNIRITTTPRDRQLIIVNQYQSSQAGETLCSDGIDNDADGPTDCTDLDCVGIDGCEYPEVTCTDGKDNDGDASPDCVDSDCLGIDGCEHPEVTCTDGKDNDGDGAIDCADTDCFGVGSCIRPCAADSDCYGYSCVSGICSTSCDGFTGCADGYGCYINLTTLATAMHDETIASTCVPLDGSPCQETDGGDAPLDPSYLIGEIVATGSSTPTLPLKLDVYDVCMNTEGTEEVFCDPTVQSCNRIIEFSCENATSMHIEHYDCTDYYGSLSSCQVDEHGYGYCTPCTLNSECGAGGVCTDGTCVYNACTLNTDCATGACDPSTHTCVECNVDDDCSSNACLPGGHVCVECNDNDECYGYTCENALTHTCNNPCSSSGDCAPGYSCIDGSCVATSQPLCSDGVDNDGDGYIDAYGACSVLQLAVSTSSSCTALGYSDAASCETACVNTYGGTYTTQDSGCMANSGGVSENTLNYAQPISMYRVQFDYRNFPSADKLILNSNYLLGLRSTTFPFSSETFQAGLNSWRNLIGADIWTSPSSYPDQELYDTLYDDYMGQSDKSLYGFVGYLSSKGYDISFMVKILTYKKVSLSPLVISLSEYYPERDLFADSTFISALHDVGYNNYGLGLALMHLGVDQQRGTALLSQWYDSTTIQTTFTSLSSTAVVSQVITTIDGALVSRYDSIGRLMEFGISKDVLIQQLMQRGMSSNNATSLAGTAQVESLSRTNMIKGSGKETSANYVTSSSPSSEALYNFISGQSGYSDITPAVVEMYRLAYGLTTITEIAKADAATKGANVDLVKFGQGLHDAGYTSTGIVFALTQLSKSQSEMQTTLQSLGYSSQEITSALASLSDTSALTKVVYAWFRLGISSSDATARMSAAGIDSATITTVIQSVYSTSSGAPEYDGNSFIDFNSFWRFLLDGYFAVHGQEHLNYPAPTLDSSALDTFREYGK